MLAIIIYPFYVQAGALDVLGWVKSGFNSGLSENRVLSYNTIAVAEEMLSSPEHTIINMPLSQSVNSPEPKGYQTASDKAMVDDSAFTNENNALDGSLDDVNEGYSDQISLYTVRKGDTVPLIAKMFGVTSNTIYWANDLKSGSEIKPDQVIMILPITGIKYTVKKGDNVEGLAKKFKSNADEIISFNDVDLDTGLVSGQEIIIPNADPDTITTTKITKKGTNVKNPSKNLSGYFKRPVIGGRRSQGIHGNNGVDIASPLGTPILAAADGVVLISKGSGWNGGYGGMIVLKHSNGTQTLYGHMIATLVNAGERVTKGQQIGKMGSTGKSTGVHLHFEVRGGKNPF